MAFLVRLTVSDSRGWWATQKLDWVIEVSGPWRKDLTVGTISKTKSTSVKSLKLFWPLVLFQMGTATTGKELQSVRECRKGSPRGKSAIGDLWDKQSPLFVYVLEINPVEFVFSWQVTFFTPMMFVLPIFSLSQLAGYWWVWWRVYWSDLRETID